ncbi:thiamine pyrophosphate-dependent enzyme, partial [Rhizobiaceae sp. 2RAB30]
MHQYLPSGPDVDLILSYQFGAIGQTVPLAIGIGMAQPQRLQIVIDGDGSALMNIQEFDTLARLDLPLILVVWNDSGYGAEFHKLRAKNANDSLGRWSPVDFAAVA